MTQFTVVIPTRDRCDTLPHTLQSCLAQDDDGLRIVVSDNYSSDATRDLVESFRDRDPRVNYVMPPRRMSLGAHWEYGVSHFQPEGFGMLLGSDDALLPGAMKRARQFHAEYPLVEALHSYPCPTYYYSNSGTRDAGKMFVALRDGLELRNSREWLTKAGRGEVEITQLPYVYQQGWVKGKVFERIKAKTGRLINSPTPDIYLAVAVCSVINEYLAVFPGFGIGGYSATSNGSATSQPDGNRALESVFINESEVPFHSKVCYTRSLPVLIGEVLQQAREVGVLPSEVDIAWDRFIARAWLECKAWDWREEERKENAAAIQKLAENFGCEETIRHAEQFTDVHSWAASIDWLRDWPVHPVDFILDTRHLGLSGSNDAAKLIEVLIATPAVGNAARNERLKEIVSDCVDRTQQISVEEAKQALKECLIETVDLRLALIDAHRVISNLRAESGRRAIERDKSKAKVVELRAKIDKMQSNRKSL